MQLRRFDNANPLGRFLVCLLAAATLHLAIGFDLDGLTRPARFDAFDKAGAIGKNVAKFFKPISLHFAVHDKILPTTAIAFLVWCRTDVKQNLRVWPVVAGNLTRSPPSLASL